MAHAKTQTLNQKRLESYLAASQAPNLDLSSRLPTPTSPPPPPPPRRTTSTPRYRSPAKSVGGGTETPRDLNARVKILELYTLHVLLRNDEWDYAREFISVSSVLDEERREAFLQALQSLQEEQLLAERRRADERQFREEQARREVEEARRLRAENEERERRRIDEERVRRGGRGGGGGSEIDYGSEQTPSIGGSSSKGGTTGQHSYVSSTSSGLPRPPPAAPGLRRASTPPKTRPKGGSVGAIAAPSLGARAGAVVSNLGALVDRLRTSLQLHPGVLMRLLFFIIGLLVMFARRDVRERISRILGISWNKLKATAGMGVKVSYI